MSQELNQLGPCTRCGNMRRITITITGNGSTLGFCTEACKTAFYGGFA